MKPLTLLSPTGHLGFTPLEPGSFRAGLAQRPDGICADSGSCDIGPVPLGSDEPASPEAWQRHDLEHLVAGAKSLGVPLIIGSCSDTGTDRGVDQYRRIVREIIAAEKLGPMKVACLYSQLPVARLKAALAAGVEIAGLSGRPALTSADLDETNTVVGVMGAAPIIEALKAGADVVLCGRVSDSAIFAAPALLAGHSEANSYYLGKVLECASFAAEPFMGKETLLGTVTEDYVEATPMHPGQRCTPRSLASHAMYERETPEYEDVAGGRLWMDQCSYQKVDERTTRVTGMRFEKRPYAVKLEGSGRVGERALAIAGIHDPYSLAHLSEITAWARGKVVERYGEQAASRLYYHVYGRDGVMGAMEPRPVPAHEVGIVVEVVADDWETAREICTMGLRNLFYARLPDVKGTAGTAALMADEILRGNAGYRWTLNHLLPVDDPMEVVRLELETMS